MSSLWLSRVVLAQGYLEMGRNFRRGGAAFNLWHVLMVVCAIAAVGLVAWLASKWYEKSMSKSCNHPGRLFRELCAVHELDGQSRWLLKQLAKQHNLSHPAQVFLDLSLWEKVKPETDYEHLRARLFA